MKTYNQTSFYKKLGDVKITIENQQIYRTHDKSCGSIFFMHFLYETNKWNSPALEFSFYMAHHHIFADGDDWKYITCITSHIIFLWYCKKSTYECHYNWCEQQPKENPDLSKGRITRRWVWVWNTRYMFLPHHHYNIPQRWCKNIKKNSLFLHTW